MSKFEWIFEKVMEAQKKFETTHLHVSVDFTIDELKDALIETNGIIAEKDAEIAQLQAMLEERNKQIGELKEERRWRKCCEGLPFAQQRVLFIAKHKTDKVREWIGDFRHIDGMKVDFAVFYASAPGWGCEFLIDEVIGWMPMPPAPKEDK